MTDPFQALFHMSHEEIRTTYGLPHRVTNIAALRLCAAQRIVATRFGIVGPSSPAELTSVDAWAGTSPPVLPAAMAAEFRAKPPTKAELAGDRPSPTSARSVPMKPPTKPTAAPSRPVTPKSAKPAQKAPPVKKKPPTHAEELASARALLARAERLAMTATDPEVAETLRACRENVMRLEMRAPSPEAAASLARMDAAFGLEKPRPMVQRANGRTTFSVHNVIRRS